jgi:hypothetical protein
LSAGDDEAQELEQWGSANWCCNCRYHTSSTRVCRLAVAAPIKRGGPRTTQRFVKVVLQRNHRWVSGIVAHLCVVHLCVVHLCVVVIHRDRPNISGTGRSDRSIISSNTRCNQCRRRHEIASPYGEIPGVLGVLAHSARRTIYRRERKRKRKEIGSVWFSFRP